MTGARNLASEAWMVQKAIRGWRRVDCRCSATRSLPLPRPGCPRLHQCLHHPLRCPPSPPRCQEMPGAQRWARPRRRFLVALGKALGTARVLHQPRRPSPSYQHPEQVAEAAASESPAEALGAPVQDRLCATERRAVLPLLPPATW